MAKKKAKYSGMCKGEKEDCPPKAKPQEFSKNPMTGFRGNKTKMKRPSGRKR